jgi:hypothetical protein
MADAVGQAVRLLSAQAVKVLKRTLTSSRTPEPLKVRAAVAVLKLAAGVPDGPTDAEDARAMVARRDRSRMLAGVLAGR